MQQGKQERQKILFFGLGSIGKKHTNIIRTNYSHELLAFRTKKGQESIDFEIKEYDTLEEAFEAKPDIAFITNPTSSHIETALECAKRNISLFIEKPISHNLENVDLLEKEIQNNKLITYVAYNLRFHPVIENLKEIVSKEKPNSFSVKCSSYLPDWRPNQEYTKSYSAKRELGGGVTLDLSHEFDYIAWLFGNIKEIDGYCDKVSDLEIDSEDLLEAKITCETGINGDIHLDYFTKKPERKITIHYNDKTIEGDLLKEKVIIKDKQEKTIQFNTEKDVTYIKQIDYFFKQYNEKNNNMMNNYSEALKTFKKIIEFKNNSCRI
jgi:predicted dehydrogenase